MMPWISLRGGSSQRSWWAQTARVRRCAAEVSQWFDKSDALLKCLAVTSIDIGLPAQAFALTSPYGIPAMMRRSQAFLATPPDGSWLPTATRRGNYFLDFHSSVRDVSSFLRIALTLRTLKHERGARVPALTLGFSYRLAPIRVAGPQETRSIHRFRFKCCSVTGACLATLRQSAGKR